LELVGTAQQCAHHERAANGVPVSASAERPLTENLPIDRLGRKSSAAAAALDFDPKTGTGAVAAPVERGQSSCGRIRIRRLPLAIEASRAARQSVPVSSIQHGARGFPLSVGMSGANFQKCEARH